MKTCVALLLALSACVIDDDPVDESEVESESVPTTSQGVAGQGTSMQGTSMQGTSMQGTSMQGTSMQGTSMQGSYGGSAVSNAQVQGTALIFWRRLPGREGWEQRFPNRICRWNTTKTKMSGCTSYALSQSPLVGSTWPTTFTKTVNGSTTTIPVTLTIQSVTADTGTQAMFPLLGSDATSAQKSCENPARCRSNSDLFLYSVMTDVKDANQNAVALCPTGQSAFALAGTWDGTGEYVPSTSQFMFACTNGTIAKCTRWGYRRWTSAIRTNESAPYPLADYHQACVRAAAADYCAIGHSFTKDGTLVDVFDYSASYQNGFIPKTRGFLLPDTTTTAFAIESYFDKKGGLFIDHARYAELALGGNSIDATCPGLFQTTFSDDVHFNYQRWSPGEGPMVQIDSTPACAHSELTVGKWLHPACSYCTGHVPAACNDPAHGWDQSCVDYVKANQTASYQVCYGNTAKTASHSECLTGAALAKYDTGCTLSVCLANPSCCSSSWTSACVAAANTTCRGGRESLFSGFCGSSSVLVLK